LRLGGPAGEPPARRAFARQHGQWELGDDHDLVKSPTRGTTTNTISVSATSPPEHEQQHRDGDDHLQT
jgi:hypothetical protein